MNPNHYSYVAARLFNTPHLIEADKLRAIAFALSDHFGVHYEGLPEPAAPVLRDRSQAGENSKPKPYQVVNGFGVIPIMGTLVHRSSWLDAMSGLTSYDQIRAHFDAAVADPDVVSVLLHIDSPGGEGSGVFDLADHIATQNKCKLVVAVGDGMMTSAAYMIAAAADQVFVSQSTLAGSIGVRTLHIDQSKMNDAAGLKVTEIFAGARKVDGSPHGPLTDESLAAIQGRVDDLYDLFVEGVSRYRGLTTAKVRSTEAAMYTGQKAVQIGLADGVKSLTEILSGTATPETSQADTTLERRTEMEKTTYTTLAALEADYPELIKQARADAQAAGEKAERERIKDILSLAPKGQTTLAYTLAFDEPCSADTAARKMLAAQAGDKATQLHALYSESPAPIPPAPNSALSGAGTMSPEQIAVNRQLGLSTESFYKFNTAQQANQH